MAFYLNTHSLCLTPNARGNSAFLRCVGRRSEGKRKTLSGFMNALDSSGITVDLTLCESTFHANILRSGAIRNAIFILFSVTFDQHFFCV